MGLSEENAIVELNEQVSPGYFRMRLLCPSVARTARPGQFVMIRTGSGNTPLLRRPISIHDLYANASERQGIVLLYRVVGQGTRLMSEARPRDSFDVLGPLGKGFSVDRLPESVCLIGGGIGTAPLLLWAKELLKKGLASEKCTVLLGGRSKNDILCAEEFAKLGVIVKKATDDGTLGYKGVVTYLLEDLIRKDPPEAIFACGPEPMLKVVGVMARDADIPCQVSVETVMACGMGACMGCAIPAGDGKSGYLHACRQGPVLDSRLLWK